MAGMSNLRLVPPVGGPIEIAGDRTLLGRDPGADLVVNDPSVSRRHALIERRPEGWVVLDQTLRPVQQVGALVIATALITGQRLPTPDGDQTASEPDVTLTTPMAPRPGRGSLAPSTP